jgi:aquaporin Z
VALDFGAGSPVADAIPSEAARRLLTGLLFAGWVPLIATSTIGRLSGSHLNHAVTLAFAVMGRVSRRDVVGYLVAQLLGAVAGAAAFHGVWGDAATSVDGGRTLPTVAAPVAAALEAAMTGGLVALIFALTSSLRTARLTPFVVWPYIASMTLLVAPYTGSSLNPARSEGPAIAFARLADLWIYVAGPIAGAVLVSALWTRMHHSMHPRTAKLFYDPRYE